MCQTYHSINGESLEVKTILSRSPHFENPGIKGNTVLGYGKNVTLKSLTGQDAA